MYSTYETVALNYESVESDWKHVLGLLFKRSDSFSLITTTPHPYSEYIECIHDRLLEPLRPFLISQKVGIRQWPGTETRDTHKVMNIYRACAKSRELLISLGNVFQADTLHLPEDICFYRDNHAIFFTVSHESMAFLASTIALDKGAFEKYL